MAENRNLIAAFVLCMLVLLGWYHFVAGPRIEAQRKLQEQAALQQANTAPANQPTATPAGQPAATAPQPAGNASVPPGTAAATQNAVLPRAQALARSPRIAIDTPNLIGSIALTGGRLDDLKLRRFHETVDPSSPEIELLSPLGTENAYYSEFGWLPTGAEGGPVPDDSTVWNARDASPLRVGHPVTLAWDNGHGLLFERTYSVDENFMFTVTQRVVNRGTHSVSLQPYGLVSRRGTPQGKHYYLLHEGLIGVLGGTLKEIQYKKAQEEHEIRMPSTGGWLGITDKYWLVSLVPDQAQPFNGRFVYAPVNGQDRYQVDYLRDAVTVPANGQIQVSDRLFAGAKVVRIIDHYHDDAHILLFDRAIDWGWFYFLTKPIFKLLDFFYQLFGNFGIAILALTILIKIIFFPLANKSYAAMSRMKALQPEMQRIRERYKDDKVKQQQELMALYKTQKVNPVAGCLPMLIQIPVFFALYKVLFVTIEMRHQPFFGWIHDLAAPDPTNIFTLFGLVPWTPPAALHLGLWPLAMGVSMFLQQKLNPAPQDPVQQRMFMLMPLFFTFLLGSFPAGLVIYWTWNNTLSIAQQWLIMRRHGAVPARS